MNTAKQLIDDSDLCCISGGWTNKPLDLGKNVDQYKVKPGNVYYFHYTGGGHDQWLEIKIDKVYEKTKILWFTERFADVEYDSGLKGSLPLDTNDIFYKK